MSFSSECRAETARVDAGRACCQETELRALTACSASYTLQGRGAVSLVYRVGSIPAARRIFVLLKNCFKVVPTLEYIQSPRFGGQRVCVLRVRDADTRRLMRLPRGGIHTVPVRSLNRKCCFQAYLRGVFLAAGYVAMALTQVYSGVMRGAGDTVTPMWVAIFNSVIIRIPLAYGLVALSKTPELPQGNCYMMQLSMLITWVTGAFITFLMYKRGRWMGKSVV